VNSLTQPFESAAMTAIAAPTCASTNVSLMS